MLMNVVYLWYKLSSYVPLCFPGSFGSFIRTFSLWNIAIQTIFLGLVYRRVAYEEKVLKNRFNKEWDDYFSQRKRFIPFVF
jgi:protein-S-isoprenylcysteine O-methyltransferase Ste14